MNNIPGFYSGTSGLVLPVPNKSYFPDEFKDKSRLTYYSSLFNSIEINSSFYKIPLASTSEKWAASVSENFRFTYKMWRDITHIKELLFRPEDVEQFMQVINSSGNKKGCLLIQLAPSLTSSSIYQLEKLLSIVRQADKTKQWKTAVEFRNRSWYDEEVYNLVDKFNMAIVIQDMPSSATPFTDSMTDFVYLRFHGPEGNYKGSYTADFLQEYALYISEWQKDGKTVYAYFNNTMGDAIKNLVSLDNFVAELN